MFTFEFLRIDLKDFTFDPSLEDKVLIAVFLSFEDR